MGTRKTLFFPPITPRSRCVRHAKTTGNESSRTKVILVHEMNILRPCQNILKVIIYWLNIQDNFLAS